MELWQYITKINKADNFNPTTAISAIINNPTYQLFDWARAEMEQTISKIESHTNPVVPPQCMRLFSSYNMNEVTDMRYFLYNKESKPIRIIYISPGVKCVYDYLNEEQLELYRSDNAVYGSLPNQSGIYYAEQIDNKNSDIHIWKSVSDEIFTALYGILYWMKFAELADIDINVDIDNNPMKSLFDLIRSNKDNLIEHCNIIALDENVY